jgi:hypothetical protein
VIPPCMYHVHQPPITRVGASPDKNSNSASVSRRSQSSLFRTPSPINAGRNLGVELMTSMS